MTVQIPKDADCAGFPDAGAVTLPGNTSLKPLASTVTDSSVVTELLGFTGDKPGHTHFTDYRKLLHGDIYYALPK